MGSGLTLKGGKFVTLLGHEVNWSTTATLPYKIWKGLVGRLEYRHDASDEKVFRVRYSRPDITSQGRLARGESMDTISVSLYYSFF